MEGPFLSQKNAEANDTGETSPCEQCIANTTPESSLMMSSDLQVDKMIC